MSFTKKEEALLRVLMEGADDFERLKSLVPYAAQVEAEAEYSKSWRVVRDKWRGTVIFLASFIGAIIFLREQAGKFLASLLGIGI